MVLVCRLPLFIYTQFVFRKSGALCLRNSFSNVINEKTEIRGESGSLAAHFFGLNYHVQDSMI